MRVDRDGDVVLVERFGVVIEGVVDVAFAEGRSDARWHLFSCVLRIATCQMLPRPQACDAEL